MKKCLLIWMFAMCVTIVACSKEENGYCDNSNEKKEYIVSIGVDGEILDINESPLTKSSGNDLYGIQVYCKTTGKGYLPYSYGVFNDISLMQIKLLSGYSYYFKVRMFPDVAKYQGGIEEESHKYFENHFLISNSMEGRVTNCFLNSNYYITNISKVISGLSYICDDTSIKSYYGELKDYTPSKNEDILIDLKLACFGIKFIAEDLNEGNLSINLQNYYSCTLSPLEQSAEKTLNFNSFEEISHIDSFSENITLTVIWNHPSGGAVPLIKQDITVKRNTLTTITIKVKDISTNNSIVLSQESEEMKEGDNIIFE